MSDGARELGPEMQAEWWIVTGGDWLLWMYPPAKICVSVMGPIGWDHCMGIPAPHGAPTCPTTLGYVVCSDTRDEHGYPIEGDSFWLESYSEAVKRARSIRASILAERKDVAIAEQAPLFPEDET